MKEAIIETYKKWKYPLFGVLSFIVPFIVYVLTLEKKLIGGDTTWYALQIPEMSLMVPTGYPTFSMSLKLFTFLPIGDLAFRLNLYSAVFGGLTILFIYLTITRLTKNEIISFTCSLIFAFLYPYWHVANRLEFDTLNSFFIALVLFSAVIYGQIKDRKFLYFFFFSLGLSLTNHPIAFFVVPAIFLYVLIMNPKIFKSAKVIIISIAYFTLPLLSYFYLLIRSRQGYGPVTDLTKLFYYVTGRNVSGEIHGGHFFDKPWSQMLGIMGEYLWIIYDVYGLVLIIIASIGLGYLIKKNWKLGMCSILFVIFNVIVPPLYLPFANDNYIIFSMILVAIFIGCGFLLILEKSIWLFNKAIGKKRVLKIDRSLKNILIAEVLLFSVAFAVFQPILYFRIQDRSEPLPIYEFWDEAFDVMEEGSSLFTYAFAENVGNFVGKYEYPEKGIKIYNSRNPGYTIEDVMNDFNEGREIYFVGNPGFFKFRFNTEKIGRMIYIDRYTEFLQLNRVLSLFESLKITAEAGKGDKNFGKKFSVAFTVENKNSEPVQITSLELELPGNLVFVDVDPEGYIDQDPGLSRGMYMWVSDEYFIDANSSIDLIVYLQGREPGIEVIDFRVTTNDVYYEAEGIEIKIN